MSEGKIKVYGRRLSNREIADLLPLSPERQRERDRMKTIVDEQCRVSSVCLELREQRDRLAEAMRAMWPFIEEDPPCGGKSEIQQYLQALAAVKGGSDE